MMHIRSYHRICDVPRKNYKDPSERKIPSRRRVACSSSSHLLRIAWKSTTVNHLHNIEAQVNIMTRIEKVEQLTIDAISDILNENWSQSNDNDKEEAGMIPKVNAISVNKVDEGVLSDVYRVHLDYKTDEIDDEKSAPPANWLAKFCRSDLDLSWMCRNETIFYSQVAPRLVADASGLPFSIPKFLSGSDRHIILQEVTDIKTYPLTEGCPFEKIEFLLQSLAAWHASCWESEALLSHKIEEELVFPTGMGQRLPPLQKEGLFVESWKDTLDHMRFRDEKLLDFITDLCQKLATLKLRDIHDKVHNHRVTCVHGDFHIANWLFPKSGQGDERKPVLVDFATAGYGNPLVDLVFFMVVSTNDAIVSDSQLFLERYYNLLIESEPSLSSKITLSTLREWFPWALLCQFLILVAYDGLCRGIAQAERDQAKRESQLEHFCNVNRRMVLALKGVEDWDLVVSKLQSTTPEEQNEAKLFCQTTPLVI